MKRILKIIIWASIVALFLWIYIFSGLDQILLNLIFLNIIAYIMRSILTDLSQSLIKNLFVRYLMMIIINIAWIVFVFLLLFYISPTFFVAIISFLVIAISLTFRDIINNIAAGLLLLSSEGFEAGDLIETNGVQGIVKEITLNHIKLVDFDGSITFIPNRNAFNASITKFTHKPLKKEKKIDVAEVIKKVGTLITGEKKLTRYIKIVELLIRVDIEELNQLLTPVFDKYESLLGIRPYFYANTMTSGVNPRLSITLQILSQNPEFILRYTDPFLKDVLFSIYSDLINYGSNGSASHAGGV